jgi:molybdopterin/thiamine biosynthesis adenylyltransferase
MYGEIDDDEYWDDDWDDGWNDEDDGVNNLQEDEDNTIDTTLLYSRQKLVEGVVAPEKVIVVGCGGVGSYVAIFLAMIGAKEMYLIDHDIVEESNRNRVLFETKHVGEYKTDALADIIMGLRGDCVVTTYTTRAELVPEFAREQFKGAMVFDCRDITEPLPDYYPKCLITGGYDGTKVTLHVNPDLTKIFGTGQMTYTVTPSYAIPPAFLALMIVMYASTPQLWVKEEIVKSFDIKDMFMQIIERMI